MDVQIDYDYSLNDYYYNQHHNNNHNNYTNESNYISDDPYSIFYWDELIPTLIIYAFTFILGLIGNCLIIFTTFRYRRMQNVTNVFLSSLASSDLLLIIICIPVKVAKLFSYTWSMGFFICKSVHYMQNVSAICSVLTLTAISIERYYAIIHPMKAKYICTISKAKKIIFIIWISSFKLAIPTLIAQIHLPVGRNNEFFWCVRNWDWELIWRFHEIYMLIVILIGPFTIMSLSYFLICWEVWKVIERRSLMTSEHVIKKTKQQQQQQQKQQEQTENEHHHLTNRNNYKKKLGRDDSNTVKQVIYMLVSVIILFAICWTPLLIDNVLTAYGILPHLRMGSLKYMSTFFHLLAYFNSCINPIIYGFMSKSFRESFVLTLCYSIKTNNKRTNSYNMRHISRTGSQTRNTSVR